MLAPLVYVVIIAMSSTDAGLDRAKLEAWLIEKNTSAIKAAFVEHEDQVLPFFDEYLEGGLAAVEEGKPQSTTSELQTKGVAFAALADEALGGRTFSDYAKAFAGLTREQQKQFREGQAQFRKGRELTAEPAKALDHLEKSLKLCAPLGDTWGRAMCLSRIALMQHALKKFDRAIESATEALTLNRSLHLIGAQAADLLTRAECLIAAGKPDAARKDLSEASGLIARVQDPKRKQELETRRASLAEGLNHAATSRPSP